MAIRKVNEILNKWTTLLNGKRVENTVHLDSSACKGTINGVTCSDDLEVVKFDVVVYDKLKFNRPKQVEESNFVTISFGENTAEYILEEKEEKGEVIQNEFVYNSIGSFCTNSDENIEWEYKKNSKVKLLVVRVSIDLYNKYVQQSEGLMKLMSLDQIFWVFEEFDPLMKLVFSRLYELKEDEIFYNEKIENLSIALIHRFFTNVSEREVLTEGNKYSFNVEPVFQAYNMLKNTLNRAISLDELSREVGLSESRLRFLFKQVFGTTISTFHQDVRLQKTKEELLAGKKTSLMIAMDYGFSSASHFSTAFKKRFKMSPKEFIKSTAR
ncbi:AraC family transcriptional regulator [Flammeovirga sp. SubArs3]|uniref:helix-turn-helix domain-containing protein n=1 Tax=Flammeovirga sp. SubArs3 TaxID=2995316 RepID=UPI00248BE285|nr:AraC family transcriptional regulator [Flammeovirga sp. SubArs3]